MARTYTEVPVSIEIDVVFREWPNGDREADMGFGIPEDGQAFPAEIQRIKHELEALLSFLWGCAQ